jgi:hypothetical protein
MKKTFLAITFFLIGGVCFAQGTSTGGGQGSGGGGGSVTSIATTGPIGGRYRNSQQPLRRSLRVLFQMKPDQGQQYLQPLQR